MRHALLPADPDADELNRAWNLSEADLVKVYHCRGDDKRFSFALQLCMLWNCGRFLGDDFASVPVRIVGRQLGLPPLLSLAPPARKNTDAEHEQRIREYLGFRLLDAEERQVLERQLEAKAADGARAEKLLEAAEQHLRERHVACPARSTIDRLIGRVTTLAEENLLGRLQERLGGNLCSRIEELLTVSDGEHRSMLARLKEYPPEPNPEVINDWLDRADLLESTGISKVDLGELDPTAIDYLAQNVRAYDVDDLKRFSPAKRQALVACFLVDAQKTTLDLLVEMHHVYLTGLNRRARNAAEERNRKVRKKGKKGLGTIVRAMEIILDASAPRESRVINLYMEYDDSVLRDALAACRELHAIAEHGYVEELRARHHHLKRYLTRFVALPFNGERGTAPLLAALKIARRMAAGELSRLPPDAPTGFVPGSWRSVLRHVKERIDARVWELALAFAVNEALRSGDLYLPGSRQHVSFWKLVYGADTALIAEQWDQLVRVASSLRSRTAPAHVVIDRLAASSPSDRLAKAMTMLGRIVKTPYTMRYLHDPAMRDRGHLQLNRGESRHDLAQRLFFANLGAFRTGDYEEIMNKVSALALLANAVLVWNTVRITEIVRGLEGTTGKPVPMMDIARVSPLAHAHVIPSGTYRFPVRARPDVHPNE